MRISKIVYNEILKRRFAACVERYRPAHKFRFLVEPLDLTDKLRSNPQRFGKRHSAKILQARNRAVDHKFHHGATYF